MFKLNFDGFFKCLKKISLVLKFRMVVSPDEETSEEKELGDKLATALNESNS